MGLFDLFSSRNPDIEAMKRANDIQGLAKALGHHQYDISWRAAEALGQIGGAALEVLHDDLYHRSSEVRLGAIEALGCIRDHQSTPHLCQMLKKDEVSEIRWAAAIALGEIGDTTAIAHLLLALNDPDKYVRYGAALSLEKLGWKPKSELERAYHSLGKQDWSKLSEMGAPAVTPLTWVLNDRDSDVRIKALEVLGDIGSRDAHAACTRALKDTNGDVRWIAVLTALRCGVASMQLPWGISKRPRTAKSPYVAAFMNFLLPGMGYMYLGRWWGYLSWQVQVLSTLLLLLFAGQITHYFLYNPIPVFVFSPLWIIFGAHAWIMAKKMPEM
jgi:HEAT repeat protein